MEDLKSMGYRGGSFLRFYEKSGLIETVELTEGIPFKIKKLVITPFEVQTTYNASTVFLIQENDQRVVYAPCDVRPFPENSKLKNLDLLIIGSFHPEGPLKEGIIIPPNNALRKELFSLKEIQNLAQTLDAKKTIIVHIEEEWGKTYDEYKQLEKEYSNEMTFAYDGMRIKI